MYSNKQNIPLAVAVFLATDNYDHNSDPREISVTTLIQPTRQIILSERAGDAGAGTGDISDLIASRLGTAVHEGIERAWLNPIPGLTKLGMPEEVINAITVNPEGQNLEGLIPVYLEKRTKKEIDGRIVSGCFDICADGILGDFKNTGTFMYTKRKSDMKYILQGSIYAWLNPEIVTDETLHIYFIFKDWSRKKALGSDKYPPSPIHDYQLRMKSFEETEIYIKNKLADINKHRYTLEADLPNCPDEDLWMDEPEYKYYANPEAKRATKVFGTDVAAAYAYKASKGKGVVKEIKSEPKACSWCPAVNCSQRNGYVASGILKL
jgi:hypothetical protein